MDNKFNQISELLPEGLSESSVNEIGELIESTISEQVREKAANLEAKVNSFIRYKIDEVKEHALKELELENETFKNAMLFETVRDIMTLELSGDDEDRGINQALGQQEELQEEIGVLTQELHKSIENTSKLEKTVKILSDKLHLVVNENEQLAEEVVVLGEEVTSLEEASSKPFKSSEKAVVIAENMSPDEPKKTDLTDENEFLTSEVMKFMPFTS
jgi:hypothetical protein